MSSAKAARRARFEGVFSLIRDELIAHCKSEGMPPEAVEWYSKVRSLIIAVYS
jgi:farnesyl diphosphate synthase